MPCLYSYGSEPQVHGQGQELYVVVRLERTASYIAVAYIVADPFASLHHERNAHPKGTYGDERYRCYEFGYGDPGRLVLDGLA